MEINDKDNEAEFNKNCQPCIGERKVTANCDMPSCELTNTTTNPDVTVNEIDEYYHHSCCEGKVQILPLKKFIFVYVEKVSKSYGFTIV